MQLVSARAGLAPAVGRRQQPAEQRASQPTHPPTQHATDAAMLILPIYWLERDMLEGDTHAVIQGVGRCERNRGQARAS